MFYKPRESMFEELGMRPGPDAGAAGAMVGCVRRSEDWSQTTVDPAAGPAPTPPRRHQGIIFCPRVCA